jgi:hypothetical protein
MFVLKVQHLVIVVQYVASLMLNNNVGCDRLVLGSNGKTSLISMKRSATSSM